MGEMLSMRAFADRAGFPESTLRRWRHHAAWVFGSAPFAAELAAAVAEWARRVMPDPAPGELAPAVVETQAPAGCVLDAERIQKLWRTRQIRQRIDIERGELVPLAAHQQAMATLCAIWRRGLDELPRRIAIDLADRIDAGLAEDLIQRAIDRTLNRIADKIDAAPRRAARRKPKQRRRKKR